ncbi:hypothetical protein Sjap_001590 [Stephania japonica]|uniref:Alpha-taxilin n=1 Tax=Stephania japonica TaxID=461633 RepID=A0AAP0KMT0_9MAGN
MSQTPRSISAGEMVTSAADQLPEADSLPDGFVESSAEPSGPRTPTIEQERRPVNCEDELLEPSSTSDGNLVVEKMEKIRTFPVPLSDKDGFDECGEGERTIVSKLGTSSCEGLASLSSYNEPAAVGSCCGHEHVGGSGQVSQTASGECLDQSTPNFKDNCTLESAEIADSSRNIKQENPEVKRKSAKRGLKSEKEFLEFTLKYQQVIAERDAAIAVRDKLESLCRELQRQNKVLMDECKRVSSEGQTMRLELSTKFHNAIKENVEVIKFLLQSFSLFPENFALCIKLHLLRDVSVKLEEQKDECLSQLKENEMLRNKLKQLADQYTLAEQQFTKKLKEKTLELQLADLKLQQHEELLNQEKSQIQLYADQVSQLLATEKNLRLQLAADGEKFQQFQDALLKSNEVFETFKQEIEKMAKSTKDLKKENIFLKGKCEKSDYALVELVEEREHMKKQLEKAKNQKEKLESLCRSLQAERKQNSLGSNSVPTAQKVISTTSTEDEETKQVTFDGTPASVGSETVEA